MRALAWTAAALAVTGFVSVLCAVAMPHGLRMGWYSAEHWFHWLRHPALHREFCPCRGTGRLPRGDRFRDRPPGRGRRLP